MNLQLKASSLTNTIFICVIISIFCGCLVLIASYFNLLNKKLYFEEELIDRNNSAFNYALANLSDYDFNKDIELDVFGDGIPSYIQKKHWGFYEVLTCKTIFKGDTIKKFAMIGNKSQSNPLALYVTDYDKPLKLSGNTTIVGNKKIPNGRFDRAYLNGTEGNNIVVKGSNTTSTKIFPKLDGQLNVDDYDFESVSLNDLDVSKPIINGFDKNTKIINVSGMGLLENLTCKGNIIIKSNSPLKIAKTNTLQDIMIDAPEVVFEDGFEGNVQILSQRQVELKPNVKLKYPSSIYVENDLDSVLVKMEKHSWLLGGVVINGNTYQGSLKRKLILEEDANIVGNLYNYGNTQLQGRVLGSVYTNRFVLNHKENKAENVILNGYINRDSLPNNFVELPLFKNDKDYVYKVIKTF